MTGTSLLVRKLLIAFVVGFFGPLLTFLSGLSTSPTWHFDKAALVSLITGCLAAGIRALLAFGPINLVPSDAQHSIARIGHGTTQVHPVTILLVVLVMFLALGGGVVFSPWWLLLLLVLLLLFF